jgi:hypothetical protein
MYLLFSCRFSDDFANFGAFENVDDLLGRSGVQWLPSGFHMVALALACPLGEKRSSGPRVRWKAVPPDGHIFPRHSRPSCSRRTRFSSPTDHRKTRNFRGNPIRKTRSPRSQELPRFDPAPEGLAEPLHVRLERVPQASFTSSRFHSPALRHTGRGIVVQGRRSSLEKQGRSPFRPARRDGPPGFPPSYQEYVDGDQGGQVGEEDHRALEC